MKSSSVSPIGLILVKGHPYVIGQLLGSGEFGAVYAVDEVKDHASSSANTREEKDQWVVKVVAKPKITKKRNTPSELAYNMLWYESTIYAFQFHPLCNEYIPNFPDNKAKDGLNILIELKEGFRCLVLERMECTLLDAIPKCIPILKSSDKFDIGSIAIKLIRICQAIHSRHHLIIDIKPENIMICQNGLTLSNKKDNISTQMANSIRMIDFGLVMNLGLTGHRPNVGISNVCGTALYASLNVHKHQTPSRRDDIEAMLYLIGELVIVCNSIMNGTMSQWKVDQSKDPAYLPWAIGTLDDDVGTIKEKNVTNIKSDYYKRMPNQIALKLMDCWNEVRFTEYASKPKYDTICQLLTGLSITTTKIS